MNGQYGSYGAMGAPTPNAASKTSTAVPVVRLDSSGQVIEGWGTGISRRAEDVAAGVAVQVQAPSGGWVRAQVPQGAGSAIAAAAGFTPREGGSGYKYTPLSTAVTQGNGGATASAPNGSAGFFDTSGGAALNGSGDAATVMLGPTGVTTSGGSGGAMQASGGWSWGSILFGTAVVGGLGFLGYRWYKGGGPKKATSKVKRAMKRFR